VKGTGAGSATAERLLTETELTEMGRGVGSGIPAGRHVVTLRGDLGSGKTTLARAICAGYGVTEDVTSPTYALVHKYASTKSPVYHLDLYRLEGPRDLQNIGFDEIVTSVSLVLVEWPERAEGRLPKDAMGFFLSMVDRDASRRRVSIGVPHLTR